MYPDDVVAFLLLEDGVDKVVAQHPNERGQHITAIETTLGTNPEGSCSDVKTRLAVSMAADGTLIGAPVDKSASYGAQQAVTDGVVTVKIYNSSTGGTGGNAFGYTDAAADPTTQRFGIGIVDNGIGVEFMRYASFTMPVRKGDYWKVTISGTITTITVYWYPL